MLVVLRGRSNEVDVVLANLLEFLGIEMGSNSIHQLVQIALHDVLKLMESDARAVVGHAVLRVIVCADALAAVTRAHLALAVLGAL